MPALQDQFIEFHDNIRLGTYDEEETLREKRDLLIDELKESLKDEKIPDTEDSLTFSKIDLGSYAMRTGVKPLKGDYDIDVGIIFDITNEQYDSNKLKQLVFDKLNAKHNRTVEFNRPCITVVYSSGYHVDLAIYSKNEGNNHIAWGKKHSTKNRCWYSADPKGLVSWVANVANEQDQRKQFRRVVRYLKKWKGRAFNSSGNNAPPSIGLTIQARNFFLSQNGNDLSSLINIVQNIKNQFTLTLSEDNEYLRDIETALPVTPFKDVYYKMSLNQKDNFFSKIDALLEALEAARDEDSDHEASKILRKVFGDDFPLIEDTKATDTKPVVTTGLSA